MKKIIVITTLVILSVGMANCSSSRKAAAGSAMSTTATTPEDKVAEVKRKYTEQQMAEGKTLWQSNCNKCHKLFEPESRNVAKWEAVLPNMVKRAHLTDAQGGMVRAYILANAKLT
jgi:cytochrome c5